MDIFLKYFTHFLKYNKKITGKVNVNLVKIENFSRFYNSVTNGRGGVFGMSAVTVTENRKQQASFSPPYMVSDVGLILTHENIKDLQNIEDISNEFKGMVALTQRKTTNEARILDIKEKYWKDLEIVYVNRLADVIQMIADNNKYFGFTDVVGNWSIKDAPLKRHRVETPPEKFGILMPKDNDWVPVISEFMNHFVTTRSYQNVMQNYLGNEFLGTMYEIKRGIQLQR